MWYGEQGTALVMSRCLQGTPKRLNDRNLKERKQNYLC